MAIEAERKPFQPRGAAKELWTCRAPEVLLSGPAGTGKTRACLEKIHAGLMRWPGSRVLVTRKTRASLTQTALVTYERDVAIDGMPPTSDVLRRVRQSYLYPNGSELVVGGLDDVQRILSAEYDAIYVPQAEEPTENDWEQLSTRLRNGVWPFQQMIGDCNPDAPNHWLKRRCDSKLCVEMVSRHQDNPVYWDIKTGDWTEKGREYILGKLARLTGIRRERLYLGRWAAAEGLVYEFDQAVHLIDAIPQGIRRWLVSIDFGFANPASVQFWAIDGDGRMYLAREIYRTRLIVSDLAEVIKQAIKDMAIRVETFVADHDAEDRATLARSGIKTVRARKQIKPGIQAVEERLRKAGDERPRLYLVRDALAERDEELAEAGLPYSTEQEFGSYCWPQGADGKPAKEVPVDLHNHGMDAMRYAVMHVDQGPGLERRVAVSY